MIRKTWLRSLVLAVALISAQAFASGDESPLHPSHSKQVDFNPPAVSAAQKLDAKDAYLRMEAVLDHFGVPTEADTQSAFDALQGKVDARTIQSRVRMMDFHGQLDGFAAIFDNQSVGQTFGQTFGMFRDRDSKSVLDYSVALAPQSVETMPAYRQHLELAAKNNSTDKPLAGLRIALDPGHMGGDLWDERTGKFVHDKKGHKLSEGVMALQISLLLEKAFKDLGADVLITRYGLTPVSGVNYDTYDLKPAALNALRQDSYTTWFQNLLTQDTSGTKLYELFSQSPQFKKLFSESERWEYFVLGYDLDARSELMNRFSPDISLVIHLDAGDTATDPNGISPKPHDGTKAYVSGAFFADQFSSREDRKYFGLHLLDSAVHDDSVKLARSVVQSFHSEMGLPFDAAEPSNTVQIEPGVLARDLRVQRQLTSHASAYVECLYYNDPKEFAMLLNTTHPMTIDGKDYPYSDRLAQIAASLQKSVVSYVHSFAPAAPTSGLN